MSESLSLASAPSNFKENASISVSAILSTSESNVCSMIGIIVIYSLVACGSEYDKRRQALFAMGKFAPRGLGQSAARELAPRGIQVAHVIVDGSGRARGHAAPSDRTLDPDAIARCYIDLSRQRRSAWSWGNRGAALSRELLNVQSHWTCWHRRQAFLISTPPHASQIPQSNRSCVSGHRPVRRLRAGWHRSRQTASARTENISSSFDRRAHNRLA
ncbi:hypothetical protein BVI434_1860021 [Burkholderia vietnamiensis]|nr:hypothetical protein BVI434_1860021 [Burkholderia vietnamiensis]